MKNFLKELPNIQENISLAPYTTFKIGGPAKYFYTAKSTEDLIQIVKLAKKSGVPFFILGNGSNILISDAGFDGLIIKIKSQKLKVKSNKIYVDSGVLLAKLASESIKAGLSGLEWTIGIPGTVGGAIQGNAGAFGMSTSDIVKEVKVLNITTYEVVNFKNKDCKFGYRDSIFKHNKNLIILSVELELKKGDREKSQELIKKYLKQRKENQPLEFPSAGCIFKNFTPHRNEVSGVGPENYSAGYLIEQCGLKGKKINGAMISEKHANFIINAGGAKAKDVKKLIDLCKEKVKEKFGIELEEEIEYLDKF